MNYVIVYSASHSLTLSEFHLLLISMIHHQYMRFHPESYIRFTISLNCPKNRFKRHSSNISPRRHSPHSRGHRRHRESLHGPLPPHRAHHRPQLRTPLPACPSPPSSPPARAQAPSKAMAPAKTTSARWPTRLSPATPFTLTGTHVWQAGGSSCGQTSPGQACTAPAACAASTWTLWLVRHSRHALRSAYGCKYDSSVVFDPTVGLEGIPQARLLRWRGARTFCTSTNTTDRLIQL